MATTRAHTFCASQVMLLLRKFRSQDTRLPMIPGSPAAALPASLASALPKACRCFFAHSFTPPLEGLGVGMGGVAPPAGNMASTSVLMINPTAVIIEVIVTPCSRNRVRRRSASVVSLFRTLLIVSRILETWDLRSSRLVLAASYLASRSS
jgi:hypothetical protein